MFIHTAHLYSPTPNASSFWYSFVRYFFYAELFDWIKSNLTPDQLILEFYTPGEPNSGWIHCSWIPEGRRASFLHAYRSEGKTKYKPILGSAREIV